MMNVQKRVYLSSSNDLFSSPTHSREGRDCTSRKKTPPLTSTIKVLLKLNKCCVIFLLQESWTLWSPHLGRAKSFSPKTLLHFQVRWAVPAVVAEPSLHKQGQLRSQSHCWKPEKWLGKPEWTLQGVSFSPYMPLSALPAFCGQQLDVFLAKAGMWTIIFAPYPQIFWLLSNLPNCSEAISTFSFYSLQWLFQVSWRFYEGVLFILAFISSYLDLH